MIDFMRTADLFDQAVFQYGNTVTHSGGFHLIMGHINHRVFDFLMNAFDLNAHLTAQMSI
ncbi:hypothetical protein D3C87_1428260 [compost metagenome]